MPRKVGSAWKIDISGQKFGKWLVLKRIAGSLWLCRCKCGVEHMIMGNSLTLGKSVQCKSCSSFRHGMEGTKIYNVWGGMKQRCQNQKYHSYKDYGGRGISVCQEWQKFENFYRDMGDVPEGMTLGRKDNDGNYEPSNCRWETPTQQVRNRRNTTFLTHNNETMSLAEWAEKIGVPHGTLKARYRRNKDVGYILKL